MKRKIDIDGFRKYLTLEERSQNTIDCYVEGVQQFFENYRDLTNENVLAFKASLMEKRKPKTVNTRLCALGSYAAYKGASIKIKTVKLARTLSVENVITEKEIGFLLKKLRRDNRRHYWMVRFLAETGARVSEFVRLTKGGLARGHEDLYTKGKIRRIYISKSLADESKKYFEGVEGEYLFPAVHLNTGGLMTTRAVGQLLRGMADKYGIRREVMHPHGFRHYCAKRLLANGAPLTLIQELLGHESLDTTALYMRGTTCEIQSQISRYLSARK